MKAEANKVLHSKSIQGVQSKASPKEGELTQVEAGRRA